MFNLLNISNNGHNKVYAVVKQQRLQRFLKIGNLQFYMQVGGRVREYLETIFSGFILNMSPPPPGASRVIKRDGLFPI